MPLKIFQTKASKPLSSNSILDFRDKRYIYFFDEAMIGDAIMEEECRSPRLPSAPNTADISPLVPLLAQVTAYFLYVAASIYIPPPPCSPGFFLPSVLLRERQFVAGREVEFSRMSPARIGLARREAVIRNKNASTGGIYAN